MYDLFLLEWLIFRKFLKVCSDNNPFGNDLQVDEFLRNEVFL